MPRGKRARNPGKKVTPLIFTRNGVSVRHVDVISDMLPVEVAKLQGKLTLALALLNRMPRVKHAIIQAARYQLSKVIRSFPTVPLSPEQCVAEIGRYNFALVDAGIILARLKSTFPDLLEQARFTVRFGQTSKKRTAGWNSFKKDRQQVESVPDPEQGGGSDD